MRTWQVEITGKSGEKRTLEIKAINVHHALYVSLDTMNGEFFGVFNIDSVTNFYACER